MCTKHDQGQHGSTPSRHLVTSSHGSIGQEAQIANADAGLTDCIDQGV